MIDIFAAILEKYNLPHICSVSDKAKQTPPNKSKTLQRHRQAVQREARGPTLLLSPFLTLSHQQHNHPQLFSTRGPQWPLRDFRGLCPRQSIWKEHL